jgi:hypothetical protein
MGRRNCIGGSKVVPGQGDHLPTRQIRLVPYFSITRLPGEYSCFDH